MNSEERKIKQLQAQEKIEPDKRLSRERPPREAIDALLAEAAERRASRDKLEKRIKKQRAEFRDSQKTLNLIFIVSFGMVWLMVLAGFIAFVKWLFW